MGELVEIYEPDEKFGTLSTMGVARIWIVNNDGTLRQSAGPARDRVQTWSGEEVHPDQAAP